MAYIKEYWNNREKRKESAQVWTRKMDMYFADEILKSVRSTSVWSWNGFIYSKGIRGINPEIEVLDVGVTQAIQMMGSAGGKMAVLNFASYKNPGGKFMEGSCAQEECLCHESYLYNVLREKAKFYEWNQQNLNRSLYTNRALYSPEILFFENGEPGNRCDVITCAAPNKSAAQKYCSVSDAENSDALESRIRFVLDIAQANQVKRLILGAYGCGVFGQDPKEVAAIFKDYLEKPWYGFTKVVFAIPEGKDENLRIFKEVFMV